MIDAKVTDLERIFYDCPPEGYRKFLKQWLHWALHTFFAPRRVCSVGCYRSCAQFVHFVPFPRLQRRPFEATTTYTFM